LARLGKYTLRFAPERFRAEFTALVEREWAAFRGIRDEGRV